MIHIFDAATCPGEDTLYVLRDQQVHVGGGYLGGAALHTWTLSEWRRLQQANFRPLPIWVAPYGSSSHSLGAIAGNAALSAMQELGLTSLVVLDIEAGFDVAESWVGGFDAAVQAGSCDVALYAVPSDLARYQDIITPLFTWVAYPGGQWTFLREDTAAWQYSFQQLYDLSVADDDIPSAGWSRTL